MRALRSKTDSPQLATEENRFNTVATLTSRRARYFGEVKYTLRAYLNQSLDVSAALARLNVDLYDAPKNLFGPDKLCCLVVLVLDPKTGVLEVVSAGMEPALILRKDGNFQILDEGSSPALNVRRDGEFASARYQLESGDLLFAFTDGLTEARVLPKAFLGYAGLTELLQASAAKRGPHSDRCRRPHHRARARRGTAS